MTTYLRKTSSILLLTLILPVLVKAQETLPYWKDVKVTGVNKEFPRTTFMSYDNLKDASSFQYENSKYYDLLNGVWKFYFVDEYKKLPENITDSNLDTQDWRDITVPGNWELQGFGEAFYVNQQYEFATYRPNPPVLPEKNPVGVYRRDIDIPSDWMNRDIFLHLAGAKSGVYVYVNGKEVGYSEDSKDPAEFLISPYLKEGKNVLTLKIFRWSTGSWLECQDFLRVSGIERDVFIWSQPKTAIQDFRVVSSLDETYKNGIFRLGLDVKNANNAVKNVVVKYELSDENGNIALSGSQNKTLSAHDTQTLSFESDIPNVKTWTSEHPNLYRLIMTVEENGKVLEVVPFKLGFRKIEIKESEWEVNKKKLRLFYVNGQAIKLKGTNIHETTESGHYISPEKMRRNFEIMKQNNINAVRLSHYPQDRKFYEMCSEYGIYVYDEANIESHGMYYTIHQSDMRKGTLGQNPDFLQSHLSRTQNMFERNKNYPCVTIWSLGNEAGNGYNFYNTYTYLKEADRNLMARPVCYERALEDWNTDMIVPQYPSAKSFEYYGINGRRTESADNRPYIPSEYSHAMGNSNGNLYDQWVEVYKYPNLQGGFIWEWIDHAVKIKDPSGKDFWAYGGDYGKDQPSDGNFVADGIVNPDQNPHPAMAEVKYCYQNVAFEAVDLSTGQIKIKNRFYFSNLSEYSVKYKIFENGKLWKENVLQLNLAPQDSAEVTIPVSKLRFKPDMVYFVNFEVSSKEPQPLVPASHTIAYEQFELPSASEKVLYANTAGPKLQISETGDILSVTSSKVNFVFDKQKGMLVNYKVNGCEYFSEGFGLQPNFWRGPTDNDYGNGAPARLQIWKESGKNPPVSKASLVMNGSVAELSVNYRLAAGNDYTVDYKIYPSGVVHAAIRFAAVEAPELPRIGVRFRLPASMNKIKYLGRGPEENYADRYKGTLVGLYSATAESMYYPYVRPQENGHHTDTRWIVLQTDKGKGLRIEADKTIEFNALRNSIEDFDCEESNADYQWNNMSPRAIANKDYEAAKNVMRKQTHEYDIVPRNFVEVCIDYKQQGLAGYDSWGSRPLPAYSIPANADYNWGFTLFPF
jgi:beta-galactosidase